MQTVNLNASEPGSGRDRILFLLKRDGAQSTAALAQQLAVTAMAVRQHLSILNAEGLVEFSDEQRKMGRPARIWQLTAEAHKRFPDHHAQLAFDMLQVVQSVFGEEGLERVTDEWTRQQVVTYRARMPSPDLPLVQRVAALVRIRREEGFMAECGSVQNGAIELVENHCAIAKAAHLCSKLCGGELTVFRAVLGVGVTVERVEHFLAGDRRCTYRILEESGVPLPNSGQ
jgi:predicted ArsR family transcriptional regulator